MSAAPLLSGWDNFYVIIGSAAAGLTGLSFVVIALSADANMARVSGLKTFVSPTVIHFSSALWISALCSLPRLTSTSLGVTMLASGAAGTAFAMGTLYRLAQLARSDYFPVAKAWIWNGLLPLATYAALGVGGALVWHEVGAGSYLIGFPALALVLIGIHNMWDVAVWILAERPERRRAREKQQQRHARGAQVKPPQEPSQGP